jgi:hypothetical protein
MRFKIIKETRLEIIGKALIEIYRMAILSLLEYSDIACIPNNILSIIQF